MCNLSKGVYESGKNEGIGIGVAQGIDKTRVESIKALMESMNLTLEKAMEILKYPLSDKEKYAAALN